MFEPTDFPFKELSDTLKSHYDTEELLYHTNETIDLLDSAGELPKNEDLFDTEPQFSLQSNDSGRYFSIDNSYTDLSSIDLQQSAGLLIVQSENLSNCEPTLLDDNTVNQFLIPLEISSNVDKKDENVTALIALQACTLCSEIFTTAADLWDHTVSVHYTENIIINTDNAGEVSLEEDTNITATKDGNNKYKSGEEKETFKAENTGGSGKYYEGQSTDNIEAEVPGNQVISEEKICEAEWLVCTVCERVLATAVEVEQCDNIYCCTGANHNRKLKTLFACEKCSALFASSDALAVHMCDIGAIQVDNTSTDNNAQTSTTWYVCDSCTQPFSSPEDLMSHLEQCDGSSSIHSVQEDTTSGVTSTGKMWNCGSCNQLFATARELYRHKRGEDRPAGSEITTYICEVCDKALGSVCALHTHRKTHQVTKPGYPCKICGRKFNQSGHLAIHMRMHTGERPYPCDICPKAFKVKVERDDHRRTHTGERPFVCNSCGKTFTAAARLREHSRIHTDQRPYRCEICGAAFRRPYARTVHTLIHTGEKPHECDICGTAFRRSGDMWKHKRSLHGVSDDKK